MVPHPGIDFNEKSPKNHQIYGFEGPKSDVWFLREKYNAFSFCSYGSSIDLFLDPSANRIIHLLKVPYVPPGGPVERGYTPP